VILLPPLMVERKVLGSNLMSFLDATTSGIDWPPSQKSRMRRRQLPKDQWRINAQEGENNVNTAGQNCSALDGNNDFTLVIESQPVSGALNLIPIGQGRNASGIERRTAQAGSKGEEHTLCIFNALLGLAIVC
jgi:hypothetical protein